MYKYWIKYSFYSGATDLQTTTAYYDITTVGEISTTLQDTTLEDTTVQDTTVWDTTPQDTTLWDTTLQDTTPQYTTLQPRTESITETVQSCEIYIASTSSNKDDPVEEGSGDSDGCWSEGECHPDARELDTSKCSECPQMDDLQTWRDGDLAINLKCGEGLPLFSYDLSLFDSVGWMERVRASVTIQDSNFWGTTSTNLKTVLDYTKAQVDEVAGVCPNTTASICLELEGNRKSVHCKPLADCFKAEEPEESSGSSPVSPWGDQEEETLGPAANCSLACSREYKPVCGSNGVMYTNPCLLRVSHLLLTLPIVLFQVAACIAGEDITVLYENSTFGRADVSIYDR